MSEHRRFPPPWSVEEGKTWFVVKDSGGQTDFATSNLQRS